MAGQTDNDNLLAVGNQIIVALNELKSTLSTLELTSNCAPNINVEPASPTINVECAPDVNVNCGGGGGGIPGNTPIDQIDDGSQVDEPDRGGDPPGDFNTWDEFDEYKCKAANWILDKYTGTLGNLSAFSGIVGGLTLAVLAGVLLFTVPPVGLIAIIVALSVLIGIDIGLCANFADIKSALENDRQNIVCGLFNAIDTQAAIAVINEAASDAISDLDMPVATQEQLEIACHNLLWNDNVRELFEFNEEIESYVGTVDCANCGTSYGEWTIIDGNLNSGSLAGNSDYIEIEAIFAVDMAGWGRYQIYIDSPTDRCMQVSHHTDPGWSNPSGSPGDWRYYYRDCQGQSHSNFSYVPESICISSPDSLDGNLIVRSGTPFNLILSISGECE